MRLKKTDWFQLFGVFPHMTRRCNWKQIKLWNQNHLLSFLSVKRKCNVSPSLPSSKYQARPWWGQIQLALSNQAPAVTTLTFSQRGSLFETHNTNHFIIPLFRAPWLQFPSQWLDDLSHKFSWGRTGACLSVHRNKPSSSLRASTQR